MTFSVHRVDELDSIKAEDWNRLVDKNNPFLRHEFLSGLEIYECLSGHGWLPCHHAVYDDNKLIGALPLYIKTNSYGEFVFDWSWADAYERAGGNYYPKLVSAIPFTPVCGPRLLVDDSYDTNAIKNLLINEIIELAKSMGLSSFHCLFPNEVDTEIFSKQNFLLRKTCQFYWYNHGYRDFQDFLDKFTSKKRKQIKRERRLVQELDIEIEILKGQEIKKEQWQIFYKFYCSTFFRKWGSPRLTYEFFLSLGRYLSENTLLILARRNNSYIAGAFAMLGNNTLYGRHWGCSEQIPYLHFELCYYQTIEYCIQHKLAILDAGVQGEHKLDRGFQPVSTWSCHWIKHTGFQEAIKEYLTRETPDIDTYIQELGRHLPYKTID